jgi:hypothetical protein
MAGGLINTIMALLFAAALVVTGWSMAMYFYEMGSEEGKKEYKGMLIGGVSGLVLLMVIYFIIDWLRGILGAWF